MIRVMHESSDFMYKLFTGIGRFYSSIALNFTKEGINGAKLTDDKVALISFSLPPTAFREFEVENPVSLTLDLGALKKSLSKLRSANSSFLLLESNGELKIVVMDQKRRIRSSLSFKANEGQVQRGPEPKAPSSVEFSCKSSTLETVLSESALISEEVKFMGHDEVVEVTSMETGRVYRARLLKDKPLHDLYIDKEGASSYSNSVLRNGLEALSGFGDVRVSFGEQVPMKLSASLEGEGLINVWVAPRL